MTFWKNFFTNLDFSKQTANNDGQYSNLIQVIDYENGKLYIYSNENNFDLSEIESLCKSVGWNQRPPKRVQLALKNSFLTIGLFYEDLDSKRMIGFGRATSDHAFHATIWDLVIDPEFQGKGLGKLLLKQLIEELRKVNISSITLFAEAPVISFYESLGFTTDPNYVRGMFWEPR